MKNALLAAGALGLGYYGWKHNWLGILQSKLTTLQSNPMPTTPTQQQQAQAALWNWYIATPSHGTTTVPWPSTVSDPELTSASALSTPATFGYVLDAFQIANNDVNGFTGYQDGVLDSATFHLLMSPS